MASLRILIILQIIYYSSAQWSHLNQATWPQTCRGALQSPIPLSNTNSVYKSFELFNLTFGNSGSVPINIVNDGHSVKITLTNTTNPPLLSGGGLEGEYVLDSFHFHWGAEHTVKGLRYPLEGHFVYFAKKYNTLANASKFKNGLAVLAVLYDDMLLVDCRYFTFTSLVPKISSRIQQPVSTTLTSLRNLLPTSLTRFYRYEGSLTTPNCDEVVVWTVFSSPVWLSQKQWTALTSVQDSSGQPLKTNYRELQSVNSRLIYKSALSL